LFLDKEGQYRARMRQLTYKLKEERSYSSVLKNMHYSINPEEIKN
jgi:hypothetical protein